MGITAFKGETAWTADNDIKLAVLPNGDYIVSRYGLHVRLPSAWCHAEVEPEPLRVPDGAMMPVDTGTHNLSNEMLIKRGPGRPPKSVA